MLACSLWPLGVKAESKTRVGERCPALVGKQVGAVEVDMKQVVRRPYIVDFWASWCKPCKAALPFLAARSAELQRAGVSLLTVNIDKSEKAMRVFLSGLRDARGRPLKLPFAVVHDPGGRRTASAYRPPTMPATFFCGADGRIKHLSAGFSADRAPRDFRQGLKALRGGGR